LDKITENFCKITKERTSTCSYVSQISNLPELIPRELLFNAPLTNNPLANRPQLSPDGKKVLYLASINNILGLWVKTIGEEEATMVIDDEKRSVNNYLWLSNKYIIYFQDTNKTQNPVMYRLHIQLKAH